MTFRFLRLGIFVLSFSVASCTSQFAPGLADDAGTQHADPPFRVPVVIIGAPLQRTKITFIWSYNCKPCREEFAQMFDVFVRARDKRDIALTIIQYEDRNDVIHDEITKAVCAGSEMYELHVYEYLFHGFTFSQTRALKGTANIPSQSCGTDELTTEHDLQIFFDKLRDHVGERINKRPVLIIGGRIVDTVRELHQQIAALDKTNKK